MIGLARIPLCLLPVFALGGCGPNEVIALRQMNDLPISTIESKCNSKRADAGLYCFKAGGLYRSPNSFYTGPKIEADNVKAIEYYRKSCDFGGPRYGCVNSAEFIQERAVEERGEGNVFNDPVPEVAVLLKHACEKKMKSPACKSANRFAIWWGIDMQEYSIAASQLPLGQGSAITYPKPKF